MALSDLEKNLLKRAIRGDKEAFGDLYVQYRDSVFRFLRYLIGDQHEADDLTSETFLRAWNAIARFEDRDISIEAWLLKIARNVAIRHVNLKRRRQHVPVDEVDVEANPRYSPEDLTDAAFDSEAVRNAVLKLPSAQREVIVLRFLDDLRYDEVEAILGKSSGAIRVIQHRALRALRGLLGDSLQAERSNA